jgi:ABC-2 type transport system permease protein
MLMAALGGAWWPLEVTPQIYQTVVKILPTTWAMMAFNDIIVRGAGVADVLLNVAVLLGFALLFFVIGIWRFRYE